MNMKYQRKLMIILQSFTGEITLNAIAASNILFTFKNYN